MKSKSTVNQEALAHMKSEGLLEGTSLALGVEKKIRQGKTLNKVEAEVLWLGITNEQVRFVKRHLL